MSQVAPRVCVTPGLAACGALLWIVEETWDALASVYVGVLRCETGHRWIDLRDADEPRLHPWRGQLRLPLEG